MAEEKLFALPSGAIPVDQDTYLRIETMNLSDSTAINIMVRFLRKDGLVRNMQFRHSLTNDRTLQTDTYQLTDGWILSVGLALADGAALRGECFVQLKVQHGSRYDEQSYQTLVSDYVYESFGISYPGLPLRSSLDGGGAFKYFSPAAASPGDDTEWTVDSNTRVRILSFSIRLVTNATVANRLMIIAGTRGVTTLFQLTVASVQPASVTIDYHFNVGEGSANQVSTFANTSFPPNLVLLAGDKLVTQVENIQGTDNLSFQNIYAEQWLED